MRTLITTLALAITTIATAQSGSVTPEQLSWANNEQTFQRLNLSPEQTTRIRDLSERYSRATSDVLRIEDPATRAGRAEALATSHKKAVRAVLTTEQLETLDKLHAEWMDLGNSGSAPPAKGTAPKD